MLFFKPCFGLQKRFVCNIDSGCFLQLDDVCQMCSSSCISCKVKSLLCWLRFPFVRFGSLVYYQVSWLSLKHFLNTCWSLKLLWKCSYELPLILLTTLMRFGTSLQTLAKLQGFCSAWFNKVLLECIHKLKTLLMISCFRNKFDPTGKFLVQN